MPKSDPDMNNLMSCPGGRCTRADAVLGAEGGYVCTVTANRHWTGSGVKPAMSSQIA